MENEQLENYIRQQFYDIDTRKAERIIARILIKMDEILADQKQVIVKEIRKMIMNIDVLDSVTREYNHTISMSRNDYDRLINYLDN